MNGAPVARGWGVAASVAVAALALFVWRGRGGTDPVDPGGAEPVHGPTAVERPPTREPTPTPPPPRQRDHAPPASAPPLGPSPPPPGTGWDDPSDGLDLPPPAPATPGQPVSREPERVPTPRETIIEQREAGLVLIDNTIERLRSEAEAFERDGDSEAAARARVRAERSVALRARRAEELETLRAGGALPSTDLEGSGGLE